ncbi:MAG: hypothetical protein IIX55_05140 [Muribaculaceae bacterium]|nr:hypothetical protein [Muribaculaceae bacterium]
MPKILTRELSINIHALNAKNKHILIYGQTHQLSHQKQQETASDDRLSYLLSILIYGEVAMTKATQIEGRPLDVAASTSATIKNKPIGCLDKLCRPSMM